MLSNLRRNKMINKNEKELIKQIRNYYAENTKEKSNLEKLKDLDKKVKIPALVFTYIFGVIGSLILGTGMCFAMKIIGNSMILGILIGIIGIVMISINYLLFKSILNKRKEKYADEIISKSNELLNETEKN